MHQFTNNIIVKFLAVITLVFFVVPINTELLPDSNAESEKIESLREAQKIAENADGIFSKGDVAPSFKGDLVALPVKDEETGETVGYIVAEKNKLISALIMSGHTKVAVVMADSGKKNIKKEEGISKWAVAGGLALAGGGVAVIGSSGGSGGSNSSDIIDTGNTSGGDDGTGEVSSDVPVPVDNWNSWSIPDNPSPFQDFAVFVDIKVSGIEVFYEITGSDQFRTSGQRISDANGQISFTVPGIAQGILTTVTVWVPGWGPQYTKTWIY